MVFELDIFKKIGEVEKQSQRSLVSVLGQVPFSNVVTAFKVISVSDLVDMVRSVPIEKLCRGLQIITVSEIEQISVEKLKIVLFTGNMETVGRIQTFFGEQVVIKAVNGLAISELRGLLERDSFEEIAQVVDGFRA